MIRLPRTTVNEEAPHSVLDLPQNKRKEMVASLTELPAMIAMEQDDRAVSEFQSIKLVKNATYLMIHPRNGCVVGMPRRLCNTIF